ncbi:c9orf72-like protein family domain-containing protein [Ditylenchus destructor]|uniref:C9orf72-like protein family domain-containing protein n=1 Tax=Ditylenchus destructor TaxID=166010 RepID=A0AAD4R6U5_9BILA|nr:c9orf72-like protein family domain-containing protein [Ditylenchus destructor]
MEAGLFEEIYSSLQKHEKRIKLPLRYPCPILKIVWSTFDYCSGPELKFAWEGDITDNNNADESDQGPSTAVDETATIDGSVSMDSSLSKNTNESENTLARDQYEDIDEFNDDLLTVAVDREESIYSDIFHDPNNVLTRPNFLDSFTSEDAHSAVGTNSTLTYLDSPSTTTIDKLSRERSKNGIDSRSTTATNTDSSIMTISAETTQSSTKSGQNAASESEIMAGDESDCTFLQTSKLDISKESTPLANDKRGKEMSGIFASCVDSGIAATISMESNLSAYLNQPMPSTSSTGVRYQADSENCDIPLKYDDLLVLPKAFVNTSLGPCEEVVEDSRDYSALTNSMATCSFMSSPPPDGCDAKSTPKKEFYREAELLGDLTLSESGAINALTDEEFVSKFVLAEQICSTQISSNPMVHKFSIVPSRRMAFGSYIFSVKQDSNAAAMLTAFSIVLSSEMSDWYLDRQDVFQEFFVDTISRFKAAYLVESLEDLVFRTTREFSAIFDYFAALEKWPLANRNLSLIKIQSSYLWDRGLNHLDTIFVAKAITACVVTKGNCCVVGTDYAEVLKMMTTLSLFIEEKRRLCSLRPFHLPFSPYLRLQAIKRSEVENVYLAAADCHWPIALVDLDRKSVTHTGPYAKHRCLKRKSQFFQVGQILKDAAMELPNLDEKRCQVEPQAEFQPIKAEASILEFIEKMCLLPSDRAPRFAWIDHFHLRLENKAKALIEFVREVSEPNPIDKRNPLSSTWNLSTVRKALGLQSDSTFSMVLARADSMQPELCEFIHQTAKRITR